jgi:hypothetical protein
MIETFRVVGLLFLGLARFVVPIYYIVVLAQYIAAQRWARAYARSSKFLGLLAAQIIAPSLYTVLYPVMPGSTSEDGFIHVSEKTIHTSAAAGALCALLLATSLTMLVRAFRVASKNA